MVQIHPADDEAEIRDAARWLRQWIPAAPPPPQQLLPIPLTTSRNVNFAYLALLTLSNIALAELIAWWWYGHSRWLPMILMTAAIGVAIPVYRNQRAPPPTAAIGAFAAMLAWAMLDDNPNIGELAAGGLSLVLYDSLIYDANGDKWPVVFCMLLQHWCAMWFDVRRHQSTQVYIVWQMAALAYIPTRKSGPPRLWEKVVLWCLSIATQLGYASASLTAPLNVSFLTSMLIYFY